MIWIADKRNCIGCGNCVQVCPVGCISFERDSEGFMYPHADVDVCIECGTCHCVCPVEEPAIEADKNYELRSYGAINKNLNVRMQSSSGGIFSLIAESILNNQGHVYGASLPKFAHVEHVSVSRVEDIPELRRSKYVQSDLVGVFPKIKQDIENGIHVLFSGTPCQVKALYVFLSQRPENLLTVEVVCHGVPSPMIFEKYLQETGAISMVFRNKDRSWSNYDVEVHYSSGKVRKERASQNLYMRGFLQNWFLRPSCSQCPAKSFSSGADITLGDFWGGQSLVPHLFDDKGTSVVFLHTHKAEAIWREVSASVDSCEVPPVEAEAGNPSINWSSVFPNDREQFFKDAERLPVLKVLKKYAGEKRPLVKTIKKELLFLWNGGYSLGVFLRDFIYTLTDKLWSRFLAKPTVGDVAETLSFILANGCSVSRFGDGELKFINGDHTWFQQADSVLQDRLRKILKSPQKNLIVCVPNIFGDLSAYRDHDRKYWQGHIARTRKAWYNCMDKSIKYYDAFISRCYMPYKDKSRTQHYFALWKKIWDGRDLLILEGEKTRLGVGNDLFDNARSIKRILCPNTQAFSYYDQLLSESLKYGRDHLVLIALGPTATVLASDLSANGYQSIDIGHLDIEYEWYKMGVTHKVPVMNKFVNEAGAGRGVGDIHDEKYMSEIVCRF